LREEPLDIRLLLSSFFRSIIPEDYSHVEYDKVLWANGGLYLPGIAGENATKILFCIDVSGSISVKEAKRFVDIAYATIRRYGIHKADFLYFDTEIKKIEKGKEDFTTFTYSGGGTSFVPIFHFLEENEYDATIILTDGYGDYPVDSSSRTEVFFAIKFGGNINRAKKYGVVAQLPRW
jgi:predicted metal-dependent peptidase